MTKICKPETAARQLSMLLRRPVDVTPIPAPAAGKLAISADYHGTDGQLLGRCLCDLAFGAFAGAALSMVPADVARESIAKRALEETLRENFAEVLNVLSCMFIAGDGRVTMRATSFPPDAGAAQAAAAASPLVAAFEVEIDGYGTGILCARTAP